MLAIKIRHNNTMQNKFYQIYHGNLSFSAIEEEELGKVIDQTYFPLLSLIENKEIKTGIELSGYTLEKIQELRPQWITLLKELANKGLIELIGSGYMQIIGPLVPYEVNLENQIIGLETYQVILGITPNIAFVNEQAFSKSMVDLYNKVGYKAIAMEWNNAYSIKREEPWDKKYAFEPVIAKGIKSNLPILWTDTILFQKFQRVAHGDIELDYYIKTIKDYIDQGYRALPIYSSDLEIFNYRPGRFETEAKINGDEWKTISQIIDQLHKYGKFFLPSEVLQQTLNKNILLNLTTTSTPVVVKKQDKYSLSRWAACGRGANYINTLCYNYYRQYGVDKDLLRYWGSDFRTHITEKKWNKAIQFLQSCVNIHAKKTKISNSNIVLKEKNSKLIFVKNNIKVVFNKNKGLTLDSVYKYNKKLHFGTVNHGDLDYIAHGADFFTGSSIIESAKTKKLTDLHVVDCYTFDKLEKNKYKLSTIINIKKDVKECKSWIIDLKRLTLTLDIKLTLNDFILGSIRLGSLTLLPQSKNSSFWYECKNGGNIYERFYIDNQTEITHHQSKSLLQSSYAGMGVTDGILRFGYDEETICEIDIDQQVSYPFVMLQNSCDYQKHLTRVFFGVQELDDTLKYSDNREFKLHYNIKM